MYKRTFFNKYWINPDVLTFLHPNYLILFSLVFLILSISCFKRNYINLNGLTQGTYFSISYYHPQGVDLRSQIDSLLQEFDKSFSVYNPTSLISYFNKEGTIFLDFHIFYLIKKAAFYYKITNGIFDPTVKTFLNKLGYYPSQGDTLQIAVIGFNKIKVVDTMGKEVDILDESITYKPHTFKLVKEENGIEITLDAIAQGYSIDVISDFLESNGVLDYKVEIGGEVRCKGKNFYNEVWSIGIIDPFDKKNPIIAVWLRNMSISTSGTYTREKKVKNEIVTDFIDARTGSAILPNIISASVITKYCVDADALSTICILLDDKCPYFLEQMGKYMPVDYFIIKRDGSQKMSSGFRKISYK